MTMRENYNGKGFFLHPSLTISQMGDKQLGPVSSPHLREIAIDFKVDENIRIIVTDDGFICPITNLGEKEIHRFLNIIVATLITKWIPSVQISWENDWAMFKYEEGQNFIEIGWSHSDYSLRNKFEFERDNAFSDWIEIPRKHVMSDELELHIQRAYSFYTNPDYSDDLLLIGQAWSQSYGEMDQASFLYGWMIIENMIERTLEKYIDGLNILPKEKDFLKNNYWKVSQRIDGLFRAGRIDDVTKETLNKLKKIRNEIVHARRPVNTNEAWDCVNVATELVYNKINYNDAYLMQGTKLWHIP